MKQKKKKDWNFTMLINIELCFIKLFSISIRSTSQKHRAVDNKRKQKKKKDWNFTMLIDIELCFIKLLSISIRSTYYI